MGDIVICTVCHAKNRLGPAERSREMPRCGRCSADLPWLVNASDADFDLHVETPLAVLVDLWAPWCGPCRMVAPVLEQLSRDLAGRLKVVKINVDENPRLAARFDARRIPTLLVMKDQEIRERVLGAQPKANLQRLLAPHL